jgi:hypothetical protein
VIARNTAFTFKGKAVDVKTLGRELNVRYVLEGSVQRSGNRLRVNVQLIDAENGSHLWVDRFDKLIADLFDMQDEIVSSLANMLEAQLVAAEARRAKRSIHPDAMDLCFQGWELLNKGTTPEHIAQARGFSNVPWYLIPTVSTPCVKPAWGHQGSLGVRKNSQAAPRTRCPVPLLGANCGLGIPPIQF